MAPTSLRETEYMKLCVCLRRTEFPGGDIWRITPAAWDLDDSRKKCNAALPGLLVAPWREYGGSALPYQLAPIHWVSLPNFSSDVDSCHFVWVPRDSESTLRGSTLVSKNWEMSQSLGILPLWLS